MKHRRKGKLLLGAFSGLLCVPLLFGVLTGCGDGKKNENAEGPQIGDENPPEEDGIEQSKVEDSLATLNYFKLDEVENLDPYAVNGLKKEIAYLLKLDADRLLADFRANADLPAVAGKTAYGGEWEGALIGGHTLGHYMSALAQAYVNAGTTDADKELLGEKIEYIVSVLKQCQDNAVTAGAKEGFLWGASVIDARNPEIQFDNLEATPVIKANIKTEAWVPWYTMHKILAGLLDLYTVAGNETAFQIAKKLGDWTYNRVSKWDSAMQSQVLGIEYGGMNDSLYTLYGITGEQKYAQAAHKFDEQPLIDKILSSPRKNYLNDKHANTTIPKIIGILNGYIQLTKNPVSGIDVSKYYDVADNFWNDVVDKHTYVTGGNSEWEHFGADNVLDRERTNCNCETCNTYNMLKLSRMLYTNYAKKKTVKRELDFLDYYEGTYYNAIWSSQNPETGMTTYFQPMASGYFKVYSTEEDSFWCCTGSGMESFSKLNDSIYYDAGNAVYVSLYVASTLKTEQVSLTQTAELENSDTVTIKVDDGATTLRLRRPSWSPEYAVKLNGESVSIGTKDYFVSVDVKKGDTVTVELKKTVTAHNLPDNQNVYAFKYGPFVLSAELGTEDMGKSTTGVNVTIPTKAVRVRTVEVDRTSEGGKVADFIANIEKYLVRGQDGKFTLNGSTSSTPYTFSYHFRQYEQRYAIYLAFGDYGTVEENIEPWTWETVDTVQPGYGQYENDDLHEMADNGSVGVTNDGTYRYAPAGKSFTYYMAVTPNADNRLSVALRGSDAGKTLKVVSGSKTLYSETLDQTGSGEYRVYIDIPAEIAASATEKSVTSSVGTTVYHVIPITFSSADARDSAKVCSFVYMQSRQFSETDARDRNIAYFVNCGDYDVYTLNKGEKFGVYNSVTEQAYGADPVTGKKWGIVDTYEKTWSGDAPAGVSTNSTWACENPSWPDGSDKAASNRYTKEQTEHSLARKISYRFDLDNGSYRVRMFFVKQWDASGAPNVSANGAVKVTNGALGSEIVFDVSISDGELLLECTTDAAALNIAYIIIEFA